MMAVDCLFVVLFCGTGLPPFVGDFWQGRALNFGERICTVKNSRIFGLEIEGRSPFVKRKIGQSSAQNRF
jgi:hypothetical protein